MMSAGKGVYVTRRAPLVNDPDINTKLGQGLSTHEPRWPSTYNEDIDERIFLRHVWLVNREDT